MAGPGCRPDESAKSRSCCARQRVKRAAPALAGRAVLSRRAKGSLPLLRVSTPWITYSPFCLSQLTQRYRDGRQYTIVDGRPRPWPRYSSPPILWGRGARTRRWGSTCMQSCMHVGCTTCVRRRSGSVFWPSWARVIRARLPAVGKRDADVLHHGPPPAWVRGRWAAGGLGPCVRLRGPSRQVDPGIVRGARAAACL